MRWFTFFHPTSWLFLINFNNNRYTIPALSTMLRSSLWPSWRSGLGQLSWIV